MTYQPFKCQAVCTRKHQVDFNARCAVYSRAAAGVDLVFIDHAINLAAMGGGTQSLEELLRHYLCQESRPAIVLVHWFNNQCGQVSAPEARG